MADTYTKARLKEKDTTNFLHPETEVDQIKKTGGTGLASIITTLLKAATTSEARAAIETAAATHAHSTGDITNFAQNVVSAIGEQTLSALGVRYSITTNGYICFGQLFGGLILQWLMTNAHTIEAGEQLSDIAETALPIAYNNNWIMQACINDASVNDPYALYGYMWTDRSNVKTRCFMTRKMDNRSDSIRGHMITVGS